MHPEPMERQRKAVNAVGEPVGNQTMLGNCEPNRKPAGYMVFWNVNSVAIMVLLSAKEV
jgi:hypothetical protein